MKNSEKSNKEVSGKDRLIWAVPALKDLAGKSYLGYTCGGGSANPTSCGGGNFASSTCGGGDSY